MPTKNTSNLPSAPELELQTQDGKTFRLSEQKGQVVLLNFWATWCVPCREEVPTFNEMQKDLGAKGLKIVGILTKDDPSGLADFQKELKQDYTIVVDNGNAEKSYEIPSALPVTVIIDRQGRIVKRFVGIKRRAEFEAAVKPLLEEGQATAQK